MASLQIWMNLIQCIRICTVAIIIVVVINHFICKILLLVCKQLCSVVCIHIVEFVENWLMLDSHGLIILWMCVRAFVSYININCCVIIKCTQIGFNHRNWCQTNCIVRVFIVYVHLNFIAVISVNTWKSLRFSIEALLPNQASNYGKWRRKVSVFKMTSICVFWLNQELFSPLSSHGESHPKERVQFPLSLASILNFSANCSRQKIARFY